jgi:hypothetical protein
MSISVVPVDVDPLEALETFAKLREVLVSERPDVAYFTVDLKVASHTPITHPE